MAEITKYCSVWTIKWHIRNIPSDIGRVWCHTVWCKIFNSLVSWSRGYVGLDSRVQMCCRQVSNFPVYTGLPLVLWTSDQRILCSANDSLLCQDHDTVWTKSRAEGFKQRVTEKWMEESRIQSSDPHATTFTVIKTPPVQEIWLN